MPTPILSDFTEMYASSVYKAVVLWAYVGRTVHSKAPI